MGFGVVYLLVENVARPGAEEQIAMIHLTVPEPGLGWADTFVARDLITGQHGNWGEHAFVRLGADTEPVHIIHVTPY